MKNNLYEICCCRSFVVPKYLCGLLLLILLFISPTPIHSQGSVLLVGGGTENYGDWSDRPYKWLVEHAPNRKILVLHYSDTTTWFTGYFPSLSPCKVSNRFINSVSAANDSATYKFILQHDGIFLRGGDQAQYAALWKNTLTQKAIKEVFQRGGVIGGTSAGEMVLSGVSYLSGNTDTGSLIKIPTSSISLVDDFLSLVPNIIADSHTNERGRIGRIPAFIAAYKYYYGKEIWGIAVDANTALAIDKDGVGEVFGGSAVAVLRWRSDTKYSIEAGKPFALQNMKFDQLLPGYKINMNTGNIISASSAQTFSAKQFYPPSGKVILDGSGNINDWNSSSGSFKKLQSVLNDPSDIISIISSPVSASQAVTINSALTALGSNSRIVFIYENKKNDPSTASLLSGSGAFLFAGNSLDSLASLLDSSTLAGGAFAAKINEGKPMLFLSDDVMLAGENAIGGIYSSAYNAYYGSLTQLKGLGLIKGAQFVPRFYQNQNNSRAYDYSENRVMGLLWLLGKSQCRYGMLIDAGTFVTIKNNVFEAGSSSSSATPILLIDTKNVSSTDFPVFHRPGRPNAVQNSSLIGAAINFIRPGDADFAVRVEKSPKIVPEKFRLEQNYPNPFNPATNISFSIDNPANVKLSVMDSLGREVAVLCNRYLESGSYTLRWNALREASGIYFAKLNYFSSSDDRSKTIKLVLIK